MLSVITKIWGILKIRNTLNKTVCFVTRLNSTTKDTEAMTRVTNNTAPDKPGRVITNLNPSNLKINNGSPGVKVENNAGVAIKSEKTGINIQVLFKKNTRLILEKETNNKQNKYKHIKRGVLFIRRVEMRKKAKVTVFIRGSIDCKNPSPEAYSSAKIDSLKKDKVLKIERSIKLLVFIANLTDLFYPAIYP